jgi:hypothetical protein
MNQFAYTQRRRGVAAVWMLVVLAILSAVVMATTWQHLAARRMLDQRHKQLQADWLARAGVELVVERLLSKPGDYSGETLTPLPGSKVQITVRSEPFLPFVGCQVVGLSGSAPGALLGAATLNTKPAGSIFLVTSEARYRAEEPLVVVRSLSARFQRVVDKDRVRLERSHTSSSP